MRRALVASALSVTLAALLVRAAKVTEIDTVITGQLAFAALLFLGAWFAHAIKSRRED
jgi:hypothetical protein